MMRSLLLKIPMAVALGLALWLGVGSVQGLVALAVAGLFLGLLLWQVFDVNGALWVPTLWRASRPVASVALTFDDGPDPDFTPRVLDILRAKQVPATFFVIGLHARARPDLVAQIDAAGHLVGNHTDRHDLSFHFRLWPEIRRELEACNRAIGAAIGKEPRLFRSPQGFKNPALGDVLRSMGLLAIGWQVRGFDSVETDVDKIVRRIASRVRPGGVVQMHDGSSALGSKDRQATLDALPRIIDEIRGAGLTFVPLDTLLGVEAYRLKPSAPAQAIAG